MLHLSACVSTHWYISALDLAILSHKSTWKILYDKLVCKVFSESSWFKFIVLHDCFIVTHLMWLWSTKLILTHTYRYLYLFQRSPIQILDSEQTQLRSCCHINLIMHPKGRFTVILCIRSSIPRSITFIYTRSIDLYFVPVVWWRNCTLFDIEYHTMSNT